MLTIIWKRADEITEIERFLLWDWNTLKRNEKISTKGSLGKRWSQVLFWETQEHSDRLRKQVSRILFFNTYRTCLQVLFFIRISNPILHHCLIRSDVSGLYLSLPVFLTTVVTYGIRSGSTLGRHGDMKGTDF